ncbi:MAG: Rho termination factor N-terminal domain-containing protein [Acidimicrobiales bacterium]
MEEAQQSEDLTSLTVAELKEIAKDLDIKISGLRKAELIDAINSAR